MLTQFPEHPVPQVVLDVPIDCGSVNFPHDVPLPFPDNYLQIYAGTVTPSFAPSIGSDPLNQREPFRIAFLQKYRRKSVDGPFSLRSETVSSP